VADPAGNAPTATEVIPAGHTASPADREGGEDQSNKSTELTGRARSASYSAISGQVRFTRFVKSALPKQPRFVKTSLGGVSGSIRGAA
jgi:hypothetical protein